MKAKPTIMLIGLGGLGSVILELLAREEGLGRIIVGSRNAARGTARCNLARLGAMAQGYAPDISFVPLDLNDKGAVAEAVSTSEIVHRETPDIILSTATMQTWWLPDLLPPAQAAAIKGAGFGVWLPVHLTLTLKLMEALRDAAYPGVTLTAPYCSASASQRTSLRPRFIWPVTPRPLSPAQPWWWTAAGWRGDVNRFGVFLCHELHELTRKSKN